MYVIKNSTLINKYVGKLKYLSTYGYYKYINFKNK